MDGKNRALDNIFTERFWRTLKYEEVYTKEYANPREARFNIGRYIHRYNHERPRQSLHDHTPTEIYVKGMVPEDPVGGHPRQQPEEVHRRNLLRAGRTLAVVPGGIRLLLQS